MNLQEAATALNIKNTSQLRKLISSGHLVAAKPGGRDWMVRVEEVERYKAARKYGRPPGSKDKQPRTRSQSRPPKEQPL